ncbi:hypothetical protein [Hyalangium versicolor]|uniref:hypothetical protein n=1 Tax=Hyalangium versicolor TaxID=2861190 RepID=UPI001CCE852F|nr:hypothetical protein [Hyalangium versicolor]
MKKMLTRSVVFVALTGAPLALAQDAAQPATPPAAPATPVNKPSADAVRDTWNYFYKGQGQGPILVDLKLCTEVGKEGPTKFECIGEIDPAAGVKANTTITVLQNYLVPQNDTVEDVALQTKQGATVRETKDVKLKSEGWRSIRWNSVRLTKAGAWTISVIRGDETLKEIQIKVN